MAEETIWFRIQYYVVLVLVVSFAVTTIGLTIYTCAKILGM